VKIAEPSFEFLQEINGVEMLKTLERIGRVCYKSEGNITGTSYDSFIRKLLAKGHESVIEHEKVSVKIICDRGVSHELVRHRIASYSQESTRYCNYSKERFGSEITFIKPCFWEEDSPEFQAWRTAMEAAEQSYIKLLEMGASPQEARSVLPNSLKTEIVATMDLREWRHFFKLRLSSAAHPQMREIAGMLLAGFRQKIPVVFDELTVD